MQRAMKFTVTPNEDDVARLISHKGNRGSMHGTNVADSPPIVEWVLPRRPIKSSLVQVVSTPPGSPLKNDGGLGAEVATNLFLRQDPETGCLPFESSCRQPLRQPAAIISIAIGVLRKIYRQDIGAVSIGYRKAKKARNRI